MNDLAIQHLPNPELKHSYKVSGNQLKTNLFATAENPEAYEVQRCLSTNTEDFTNNVHDKSNYHGVTAATATMRPSRTITYKHEADLQHIISHTM